MTILNDSYKYSPFPNEEFRRMPSADGVSDTVLSHYLLGDVSARNEWLHQPDKARNTFISL